MNLVPVKSSNIAAIGYEPATRTLGVQFKDGGLYHYANVPPERHAALMRAPSHGKHFAEHIRGKYDHKAQ